MNPIVDNPASLRYELINETIPAITGEEADVPLTTQKEPFARMM